MVLHFNLVDVEVDAETQAEISDAAAESLNADLKPEMDNFETLKCSLSSGSRAWDIIEASTYKRPKALNLNWEKAWQTLNLKNDILFSNFNILGAELRALLNMKAWAQLRLKKSSQILSLRQPALGYGKEGRGALRCKEVLYQITNGW